MWEGVLTKASCTTSSGLLSCVIRGGQLCRTSPALGEQSPRLLRRGLWQKQEMRVVDKISNSGSVIFVGPLGLSTSRYICSV